MSNTGINGPCSACGDGDTAMKYHNHDADPLAAAANSAWLEYARGTWSETDKRIFMEGFRRGVQWQQRRVKAQARYEEEYERRYGSNREC